ncbi:permease [Romeria aff. gracilis LEGE 07310]|uniref:Permease n=1 Tax=Vasconcelosia minhoensis LEGE 07310 TaxID=915328 RepID=A0A8J7ANY1_9CYAN|nr:permease [Romeria gracilis]MBE9078585.1 permease [Romeria aff. gracilis LEGE 07310]
MDFLQTYSEAALTSLGYFWKALWAFVLGYIVSSMIQVFVTRDRMQKAMGEAGKGSVALGTFFGFISSSCSFAALSTTKSLFKKGAGFIPAIAFLLASTNLVIELGIIIAVFLGWQFVVGEYVGGVLLILFAWLFVKATRPRNLIRQARKRLREEEGENQSDGSDTDWKEKIQSKEGWQQVAQKYFMEWGMVWKDVTVGFTIAGIISAFVPQAFFQTLFIGAGEGNNPSFLALLENIVVGPVAAFFTFIGSMGNIPLAAVLYGNGVSFAGVMAFIFSDLVVFPVIRVNAKYYGWKMALYILALLFASLIATSLVLHYGFSLLGLLPQSASGGGQSDRFAIDYTFFLNLAFLALSGVLAWLRFGGESESHHHHGGGQSVIETVLFWLAIVAYVWLAGGLIVSFIN